MGKRERELLFIKSQLFFPLVQIYPSNGPDSLQLPPPRKENNDNRGSFHPHSAKNRTLLTHNNNNNNNKMGSLSFFPQFLLLAASLASFVAESKTYWGDTEVLKELKNSIDPASLNPGSCVYSWDFTLDPCDTLFGDKFTCDAVESGTSRVTELSLDQAGYTGSLANTTWNNLTYLEALDVSNNYFSGQIPESLSNLTRLRRLGLSRNSLTGEIPCSIGSLSNLEELYLDNNNLEGAVPASFNGLTSLKRLELQFNKLKGCFQI